MNEFDLFGDGIEKFFADERIAESDVETRIFRIRLNVDVMELHRTDKHEVVFLQFIAFAFDKVSNVALFEKYQFVSVVRVFHKRLGRRGGCLVISVVVYEVFV